MNEIISISEVEKMTNLSRSTISRLEKKSIFPKRIHIANARVGWIKAEVLDWIEVLKIKRGRW
ncbi:MAG: putative DNA-binding transcriptional regulator AlpA [Bacteriovoracaceae bacterium]|jgi:predicted DNA-binding transcriptional regulator AlpA